MNENMQALAKGNAQLDSADTRGWFIGSFLPESAGLRKNDQVEIKWGVHKTGEARTDWVTGETRTTVCILVSGVFKMRFHDEDMVLDKQGDYVMWGPGVDHAWEVVEDCVTMTIRWFPKTD